MRRRRHWLLLAAVSVAFAGHAVPVGAELVNLEARPHLDVNSTRFADSSLVDFTGHLSSPSASGGFLHPRRQPSPLLGHQCRQGCRLSISRHH